MSSVKTDVNPRQQNDAYNPFSVKNQKYMICDIGNVELFELCETIPKVQCSECLLYWNQGIVYCICGHLLGESEASRHFHQWCLLNPCNVVAQWSHHSLVQ